jgi:hypothetical protein
VRADAARENPGLDAAGLLDHLKLAKAALARSKAEQSAQLQALHGRDEKDLLSTDNVPDDQEGEFRWSRSPVLKLASGDLLSADNNTAADTYLRTGEGGHVVPPHRALTGLIKVRSLPGDVLWIRPRTLGSVPRHPKKPRRLVVDGRAYLCTLRHSHRVLDSGLSADCRETLTLYPQPVGTGGPLRIVFAEGPGRYVPGGFPMGSGDVGYVRGGSLNLHEPGAVRALLDAALARGWQPGEQRAVEVDGWPLLEAAAATQAGDADPAGS